MIKCQISFGVLIASLILLTGFKKNIGQQNISSTKSVHTYNGVGIFSDPVKVSIAGASVIQGDKGERPVKAMVYLSRAVSEPVTVEYSTKNGSAIACVDYVATKGSVTFQPGEAAKWITISIIGEVAADPDEDATNAASVSVDFKVFLDNVKSVIQYTIEHSEAIITIIQKIALNPPISSGDQAVYEVIISFTGYISLYGNDPQGCAGQGGIVVLSGLLSGIENVASDDDIDYTGNLDMIINMNLCSVTRPPGSSEDKWCGIKVDGSGKVFTELEMIYGSTDSSRGGYIKIENQDGRFIRTVTGDCDAQQIDDEWVMVPNKSIASAFNGTELRKLTTRTLRKGIYVDIDPESGNKTVVEVLRKIK